MHIHHMGLAQTATMPATMPSLGQTDGRGTQRKVTVPEQLCQQHHTHRPSVAVLVGQGTFKWVDLAASTTPPRRGKMARKGTFKPRAPQKQAAAPVPKTKKQKDTSVDPSVSTASITTNLKAGSGYRGGAPDAKADASASIAAVYGAKRSATNKRADAASVGIASVGSASAGADPAYERAADPEFLLPVNPEVTGERWWLLLLKLMLQGGGVAPLWGCCVSPACHELHTAAQTSGRCTLSLLDSVTALYIHAEHAMRKSSVSSLSAHSQ